VQPRHRSRHPDDGLGATDRLDGALPRRILPVEVTPDTFVLSWGRVGSLGAVGRALANGWWLAALLIAFYVVLFGTTLRGFPYSGPFSTVDEQLNYYVAAKNFNRFGFTPTAFLHDFSLSTRADLHPYVYNHMPPGPEIVTALMMRAFGERYVLIRLAFALVFVAGVAAFLVFAREVLAGFGLTGEGYTLLFLKPAFVLHTMDHPAFSPFLLLAFLPLVLMQQYARRPRRWRLVAALVIVFVAANYLPYQNLFMLFVTWIALAAFRLVPFQGVHALAFLGAAVAGIVAHALQSVVLFGPAVFVRETMLALSNRMFGVPNYEDLKAFYRSIDVVHHGTHHLDVLRLGRAVAAALRIVGTALTVVLLLMVAGLELARLGRMDWGRRQLVVPRTPESEALARTLRRFVAVGVWVGLAIVVPMLMFPAYSADYGLSGMNEYFLGIAAVAAYGFMLTTAARWFRSMPWRELNPMGLVVWLVVVAVAAVGMAGLAEKQLKALGSVEREARLKNPDWALLEITRLIPGQVVMTNVYPTTAGFFTHEAAYGGCEEAVFHDDGSVDPNRCHTGFFKGFGRTTEIVPTHYVLFRALFTGFTMCLGECLEDLHNFVAARHEVVVENERFTIFRLRGPVEFSPIAASP
jgi:hypothetical protein